MAAVRLHRPTLHDAGGLLPLWQNAEVMRYLGGVCDPANAATRLRRHLDHWAEYDFGPFVVVADERLGPAGLCGLSILEQFPQRPIELSFMFFPWAWGQGIATAAATQVLRRHAHVLEASEVVAITLEANSHSRALLARLGFIDIKSLVLWNEPQRWYRYRTSPRRPDTPA